MDIIIVGGGIAGLYTAYKILQKDPNINLLLIESNKLGGRIGNELFHGERIVTGAGVGRKEKDVLLKQLLKELKVPCTTFESKRNYAQTISCDTKTIFHLLKKQFKEAPERKSFKDFAVPFLGNEMYNRFVTCVGFTDYENEDAYETFFNYGFEDDFESWTAINIPWNVLIQKLLQKIGRRILFARVTKISQKTNIIVRTDEGEYECKKLVIATEINSLQKLLPFPIYKQIRGQPFLRVYGKFSKASTEIMKQYIKGYTIVPGPLQKIIPMGEVYMIAYSDNHRAKILKKYLKNTIKNRDYFCRLIEKSLGIQETLHLIDMRDYYWETGTHYFEPLSGFKTRSEFIKRAQSPSPNIRVVGELISTNQGWVEGALESVESIKKWLHNI
jgi:hypothetical protein